MFKDSYIDVPRDLPRHVVEETVAGPLEKSALHEPTLLPTDAIFVETATSDATLPGLIREAIVAAEALPDVGNDEIIRIFGEGDVPDDLQYVSLVINHMYGPHAAANLWQTAETDEETARMLLRLKVPPVFYSFEESELSVDDAQRTLDASNTSTWRRLGRRVLSIVRPQRHVGITDHTHHLAA